MERETGCQGHFFFLVVIYYTAFLRSYLSARELSSSLLIAPQTVFNLLLQR